MDNISVTADGRAPPAPRFADVTADFVYTGTRPGAVLTPVGIHGDPRPSSAGLWRLFAARDGHLVALPSRQPGGELGFMVWICCTPHERAEAELAAVGASPDDEPFVIFSAIRLAYGP